MYACVRVLMEFTLVEQAVWFSFKWGEHFFEDWCCHFCYFLDCFWEWLFLLRVYLLSAQLIQQIKDFGKTVNIFFSFLRAISLLIPVWPSGCMVMVDATNISAEVSVFVCKLLFGLKPLTCLWLNNIDVIMICSSSYGCTMTAPSSFILKKNKQKKQLYA